MFCQNCGKGIADNAKFCPHCGTVNNTASNSYNGGQSTDTVAGNSSPAPQEKPKKKTKNIIIALVAMLVAGLVGKFVIAPALVSDYDENTTQKQTTNRFEFEEIDDNVVTIVNPDYTSVFTDRYIVNMDTVFYGLDSNAYVMVYSDGMIEKLEFGYKDDAISEMVDTLYYPISEATEEEVVAIETTLKEYVSPLEELNFCEVSYSKMGSFYSVVIKMEGLDNAENVNALSRTGIDFGLTGSGSLISMEKTDEGLLRSGFIKKSVEA